MVSSKNLESILGLIYRKHIKTVNVRYKREDMSVEIVGAQGFDYQYTVTLYMILNI